LADCSRGLIFAGLGFRLMSNETPDRSAEAPDREGHSAGGGELRSPLQARAAFVKNWDWQSVVGINRGACARGGAQHGFNSETSAACAAEWESLRSQSLTLAETLDRLRRFHRQAPFLFFNGNTFAAIGRELALALFSDLSPTRNREVSSAVAHYIAGVLHRDAMVEIVEALCEAAAFQPSDRVQTLRGTRRGVVVKLQPDGRVVWRPDGSKLSLMALPESLRPIPKRQKPRP